MRRLTIILLLALGAAYSVVGVARASQPVDVPVPCPPASPNHGATPPNCGNGQGGAHVVICPPASPNAGEAPPCGTSGGPSVHVCPPASPNAGEAPPCGNGGGTHVCPLPSPNAGATPPNCGNGNGGGGGGGGGQTCPPDSPNPGGTPPNCGHAPPPDGGGGDGGGATTCSTNGLLDGSGLPVVDPEGTILNKDKDEAGGLSGPLHKQLEPAIDGLAPVVHEVNCDVVVSLGL
jgi:hypothetical protein